MIKTEIEENHSHLGPSTLQTYIKPPKVISSIPSCSYTPLHTTSDSYVTPTTLPRPGVTLSTQPTPTTLPRTSHAPPPTTQPTSLPRSPKPPRKLSGYLSPALSLKRHSKLEMFKEQYKGLNIKTLENLPEILKKSAPEFVKQWRVCSTFYQNWNVKIE